MVNRFCLILVSFLIFSFLFTSCSMIFHKTLEPKSIVIFPPPPDTTRVQFLTSISSSYDITGKQNYFQKIIFGEDKETSIVKPYGIAIHKGKIYVCDKGVGGLETIDLEKGVFDVFLPSGKGKLIAPLNCFIDSSGFLYVADPGRSQVVIFDDKGNYLNCIGEKDNFRPTDVCVANNKIWVVNNVGHKIHVYNRDSTNQLLYSFTQSESGENGYLYSPTNIIVNNDKVYVTDFGDFKIKIFSQAGLFMDTIGSYGINMGQLAKPKGIAVDRESNLYVVDAAFENVQVFNRERQLLMFFGGSYTGSGSMYLPAKVVIDYDNLKYFEKFVDPSFELKYLILVTNQFGPEKISVYGRVEPLRPGVKEKKNGKIQK